ncbi:MAG: hypothetical protein KY453_09980, partial [Gemmatimonadetes bacterium]|nr:hypothetical protein [Gemmatimonadota bacterium]
EGARSGDAAAGAVVIAAWGAFVLLAAGFAAYAIWTYRKRELPIRGRDLLAGLRASTLVLQHIGFLEGLAVARASAVGRPPPV